jgi:hypothetical protein
MAARSVAQCEVVIATPAKGRQKGGVSNPTECPECAAPVTVGARRCRHCGAVFNLQARKPWVWILAATLLVVAIYLGVS